MEPNSEDMNYFKAWRAAFIGLLQDRAASAERAAGPAERAENEAAEARWDSEGGATPLNKPRAPSKPPRA